MGMISSRACRSYGIHREANDCLYGNVTGKVCWSSTGIDAGKGSQKCCTVMT